MHEYPVLLTRLGYTFRDQELLRTALTHRSASKNHYERMEFLGDAVLNLVISNELYQRFPDASEGELSRLRANLVKGDSLSKIAVELALGDFLRLGSGELKSGGFRRKSILADVLEGIIGAIYLDGGMRAAEDFIRRVYSARLANANLDEELKDPKTRLQELLQSRGLDLPDYEIVRTSGQAHNQTFEVSCSIAVLEKPVTGTGSSRRKAEQAAAERALALIQESDKS